MLGALSGVAFGDFRCQHLLIHSIMVGIGCGKCENLGRRKKTVQKDACPTFNKASTVLKSACQERLHIKFRRKARKVATKLWLCKFGGDKLSYAQKHP